MTYDQFETSEDSAEPVELFTFSFGSEVYTYTSTEDVVIVDSVTYTPDALKRDSTKEGPANRRAEFAVEMPAENDFAQLFSGVPPGNRIQLEVRRYHRPDTPTPEVRVIFEGYVTGIEFIQDCTKARVKARSEIASLSKTAPRVAYQAQCNAVLFDGECQVVEALFSDSGVTVDAIDGRTMTVSAASKEADGWYTGGIVELVDGSDARLILSHTGSDLELLLPFRDPQPTIVTIRAGCDHLADTCASKFSNLINFRGYKDVPTKNPFQVGID